MIIFLPIILSVILTVLFMVWGMRSVILTVLFMVWGIRSVILTVLFMVWGIRSVILTVLFMVWGIRSHWIKLQVFIFRLLHQTEFQPVLNMQRLDLQLSSVFPSRTHYQEEHFHPMHMKLQEVFQNPQVVTVWNVVVSWKRGCESQDLEGNISSRHCTYIYIHTDTRARTHTHTHTHTYLTWHIIRIPKVYKIT
jgi:hypothetical protein